MWTHGIKAYRHLALLPSNLGQHLQVAARWSMLLLVRDSAAPNHPVIGIAALGSSMAQQTQRDRGIGWDSEVFVNRVTEKPTVKLCRWVHESVKRLLGSIYINDLLNDGILGPCDLKMPKQKVIDRL